jgi:DNA-binding transcriptional MerR regulator
MKSDLAGLVRRDEFCRQLGISPRTARLWAQKRYGPPVRRIGGTVGGRVYYAQAEIDEFLSDIRTRPSVVA